MSEFIEDNNLDANELFSDPFPIYKAHQKASYQI